MPSGKVLLRFLREMLDIFLYLDRSGPKGKAQRLILCRLRSSVEFVDCIEYEENLHSNCPVSRNHNVVDFMCARNFTKGGRPEDD